MNIADYLKTEISKWPNWLNLLLLKCNIFGAYAYGPGYLKALKSINDTNPEKELLKMTNYAIKHVPYYRKRYGTLELHSIDEFRQKIGFIDKKEVMEHWQDFLVDDINWDDCQTGTTGGTSGKPLKLVVSRNRYVIELSFMHRLWFKSGWKYHTRGVIRNHNLNGKDYIVNPVTKEIIFDAFRISSAYVEKIVDTLRKFNIKFIHAYPSAAYQFCQICKKNGLDISFIHSFLCGSEGITDEQKFFFRKNGITVYSWYGHSEKLILAGYDYNLQGLVIENKYGFFELIDEDDKCIEKDFVMGEMVGTTFYNKFMPLIRYRTGDFAQMKCHPDKLIVLDRILGRWEKTLIYKEDGTTTSLTALNLHGDFYSHINGMQYIQEKKGELTILIIKGNQYSDKDESFIIRHVGYAMGKLDVIKIQYVDKLTFQENGKFLPLISKIK